MKKRISYLISLIFVQISLITQCSQNKFQTVTIDTGNSHIRNIYMELHATFPEGYGFEDYFPGSLERSLNRIGLNLVKNREKADGTLSVKVNGKGIGEGKRNENQGEGGVFLIRRYAASARTGGHEDKGHLGDRGARRSHGSYRPGSLEQ